MNYTYKTISNSLEFEAMLSSPDLVPPPNVAFKFYTPTYQQSRRYIWKAHTWYATGPTTKYNSNPQKPLREILSIGLDQTVCQSQIPYV